MAKRCCCCLTSILLMLVIIVGIIFGVGIWAYGKYAEPLVGLKFSEAAGIVTGLYSANEKKIVTNPYDAEADLKGFLSNFKKSIFVSEDTDISVNDIMQGLIPSNEGGETTVAVEPVGKFADGTNNTGNSFLDDLLAKVNFDFSSLENYDGSPHLLQLTDKQIAALLNDVFKNLSEGTIPEFDDLTKTLGVKIDEVISVEQVLINGADINNQQDAKLSITIKIKLKDLVKSALTNNGLSQLSFLNFFLPKNIFITATVYPKNEVASAEISINNFSNVQQQNLKTLIDTVFKNDEGQSIFRTINSAVYSIMKKVDEAAPIYYVDSQIEAQPVSALLKALNIDSNVSEKQFLSMIRNIKYVDIANITLDNVDYSQYKQGALNTIKRAYGIQESVEIDLLKDGAAIIDKVDMSLAVANGGNNVVLTDKEFASLFKEELLSNESIQQLSPVLGRFALEEKGNETTLALIVEIDTYGLLTKNQNLAPYIKNMIDAFLLTSQKDSAGNYISQKFYLELDVTMSDAEYPVKIRINGMDVEQTQSFVNTLSNILLSVAGQETADLLNLTNISNTVSNALKSAINTVQNALSNTNAFTFKHGSVELPGIYTVMKGVLGIEDVAVADIKTLMEGLYNHDAVLKALKEASLATDEAERSNGLNAFIAELREKYFIKKEINSATLFDDISALAKNIDANTFRMTQEGDKKGLLDTTTSSADLNVLINGAALAGLLNTNAFNLGSGFITTTTVIGVKTSRVNFIDYLEIAIELVIDRKYDADGKPLEYANFKPQKFYGVATINMSPDSSNIYNYAVDIKLNNFDDNTQANFFKVIKKMTSQEFALDTITSNISSNIKSSMEKLSSGGALEPALSSGGIVLPNVFELVANVLFTKGEREQTTVVDGANVNLLSEENFRKALQGMNDLAGYGADGTTVTGMTVTNRLINTGYRNSTETPKINGSSVSVYDKTIAKLVDSQITTDSTRISVAVELMQVIAASASETPDVFGTFGMVGGKVDDMLILTVSIPSTNFADEATALKDILPASIFASLMVYKDGNKATEVLFNNLDDIGLLTLEKIVNKVSGTNEDGSAKLDIEKIKQEITDVINGVVLIKKGSVGGLIPSADITVSTVKSHATYAKNDDLTNGNGIGMLTWNLV